MSSLIWRVEHFDEIDSTNTYLVQQIADDVAEGLVALADYQRVGRGRLDRRWESPSRASLMCSIFLRPRLDPAEVQWCVAAVALSARAALVRIAGVRPDLKWPNDLIVGNNKLAGILAEAVPTMDRLAVVVGLGVNLTYEGPEGVNATCVLAETGLTIAPRALLDLVLEELEARREQLDSPEGVATLRSEYESALTTIGRIVRVEQQDQIHIGRATGVDGAGQLLVEIDGDVRTFGVGDVTHLRLEETQ